MWWSRDIIEVDENGVPLVESRPKPRGLLPVPPEETQVVEGEANRLRQSRGIVITDEARRRMMDDLTMQFYYEGYCIAHRRMADGVEVLAVGIDEIGRWFDQATPSDRASVVVGQP
jgi:hypothetical protein